MLFHFFVLREAKLKTENFSRNATPEYEGIGLLRYARVSPREWSHPLAVGFLATARLNLLLPPALCKLESQRGGGCNLKSKQYGTDVRLKSVVSEREQNECICTAE